MGLLNDGPTPLRQADIKFADDNEAFLYVGYEDKCHHYWIALRDTDGLLAINTVRVWLGPVGRMVAELDTTDPVFVSGEPSAVVAFIHNARRARAK
jgi:hypothetical protein